jgi:hypothetical protein
MGYAKTIANALSDFIFMTAVLATFEPRPIASDIILAHKHKM